ncbi:MAG: alpha/beta hydrolase, partial [Planctomycetota bacterium]|nr:alpha/beta hydrolase [Planctomycetota bacterium]
MTLSRSGCVLHEGLGYSSADPWLKLDLFTPPPTDKTVPCVVVIAGGGFLAQDGQRFRHFAEYLAENGFAAALIAYRGRPHHTCRETISDAKAAVRFVRSISGEYGIDPNRVGAVGRSAGGALAVLLAVTGGMAEFESDGGNPAYSSRVQAAAGIAGVYDFVARFATREQVSVQPEVDRKIKSNAEWIGAPFSTTDESWLRASAINHVKSTVPPILL